MAATILAEGAALNTEYYTKKEALAWVMYHIPQDVNFVDIH
jgi:hypothetical protein